MKILQVGLGGFGGVWLESVVHKHEELQIVGLVDVSKEAFERMKEKLSLDASLYFANVEEAIAALRAKGETPDFILNVTPSKFHREIDLAAIHRGIPIMSEKPLADSMEEAQSIVSEAEAQGVPFAVSQNYRYKDIMLKAKQLLQEGSIGRIENIYVEFFRAPQMTGYRLEMPDVLLIDMAIHHFDLMRYLTGEEPTTVDARSWNPSWSWFKGDANLQARFSFSGGIRAFYTGSWVSRLKETSWDGIWKIEGTEGSLTILDGSLVLQSDKGEEVIEVKDTGLSMRRSLDTFIRSVKERTAPPTSGKDNILSFGMVTNSLRSIRGGAEIRFDDITN
jgi:predicted dehydrogenase